MAPWRRNLSYSSFSVSISLVSEPYDRRSLCLKQYGTLSYYYTNITYGKGLVIWHGAESTQLCGLLD